MNEKSVGVQGLLEALGRRPPLCPFDALIEDLAVSRETCRKTVNRAEDEGLIEVWRDGQRITHVILSGLGASRQGLMIDERVSQGRSWIRWVRIDGHPCFRRPSPGEKRVRRRRADDRVRRPWTGRECLVGRPLGLDDRFDRPHPPDDDAMHRAWCEDAVLWEQRKRKKSPDRPPQNEEMFYTRVDLRHRAELLSGRAGKAARRAAIKERGDDDPSWYHDPQFDRTPAEPAQAILHDGGHAQDSVSRSGKSRPESRDRSDSQGRPDQARFLHLRGLRHSWRGPGDETIPCPGCAEGRRSRESTIHSTGDETIPSPGCADPSENPMPTCLYCSDQGHVQVQPLSRRDETPARQSGSPADFFSRCEQRGCGDRPRDTDATGTA